VLIRNAELDYGRCVVDLRLRGNRIVEIGDALKAGDAESVTDARGAAVLPGLHDHHIHLFALAASLNSVHCGPPAVQDKEALRTTLAETGAGPNGWIRGDAYHESVAGELDRHRLDELRDDLPLRIQHRSGAMWFLNTRALERLGADRDPADAPAGLERDAEGKATGRLFRCDAWIRQRMGATGPPALEEVGRRLASLGITGCTDATAANSREEFAVLKAAQSRGALPVNLLVMGSEDLLQIDKSKSGQESIHPGALKILLDDVALPTFEALAGRMSDAHAAKRPVAVHCVTRVQLLVALAAWNKAGARPGDRIEHAAICPPETASEIARAGISVVTQPIFVHDRGDRYLADVDSQDIPWLYRCRGLVEANIPLAAGSDAPYGDVDPWKAMLAAVERRTGSGAVLGDAETLSPERAVELFTTPLDAPGGAPRRIAEHRPADLCVLTKPWAQVRTSFSSSYVAVTVHAGVVTYRSGI